MQLRKSIAGEIENVKRMINRGECEKMKRHAETHETNEEEGALEKMIDWARSVRIF